MDTHAEIGQSPLVPPKRCEASSKATPRGGYGGDDPICGWYWPVDERHLTYHYCTLARDHDGDHVCADDSILARTVPNPSYWSTSMIKGRLVDLVRDIGLYRVGKNPKLADVVEWVVHELPDLAPNDPRTPEALAMARVLWSHERT